MIEAVADLDQMVSTQTQVACVCMCVRPLGPWCKRLLHFQELKVQLLHDWSHAFAQGNRKIDDAFRYVSHAFVTEVNVTTRPTDNTSSDDKDCTEARCVKERAVFGRCI